MSETNDVIDISTDEVRESLRSYFERHSGAAEVRAACDAGRDSQPGFDREGWRTIAEHLGLAALGAPPEWGGLGGGLVHLVAALEECGATLYPGPARAACTLAALLPVTAPAADRQAWATQIEGAFGGEVIVGMTGLAGDAPVEFVDGSASGTLGAVSHGLDAGLVLSPVGGAGGAVAIIDCSQATARRSLPTVDLSMPRADIVIEKAPTLLIGSSESEAARCRAVIDVLSAADQVGGAQGCLTQMVDYASQREQFGELIGSYQAIQHRCAMTAVAIATARSLTNAAAQLLSQDRRADAILLAGLARAEATDCFSAAAASYIQVLGGIGFTWEHDAHLFFRRSRATAVEDGSADARRADAVAGGALTLLTAPLVEA